jgi:membrane associated rhomboid family serine protease
VCSLEPLVAVGVTRSRREAEDWALVLSAEQIPHELRLAEGEFQLRVQRGDAERSAAALRSYEQERLPTADPRPPRLEYGATAAGFALAALLPLFFWVVEHSDLPWLERGSADSTRILQGELWRAVTSLTLHADVGHVLGNALSCALFATLLFRTLGPGLGASLMLGSGALANLANAALHGPGHVSIGASSAVFGAVGVLVGLQCAERWRFRFLRRRAWLPLAAGLALLAQLGTGGERTDILAHGLGLLAGAPLGAGAALGLRAPPRGALQACLLGAALATLAGAWLCALQR